ncbi:helix-turn-helix domain-containing protein [Aeromicrobium sp. YIM 150415]|uniref:PucR family transcriptional regulator n=1 Tax=Aeromicrobium sp. YIM 150415 TaxID=2803912 RepID=UPI001963D5C3|nr:helix-turn-helix domain-containing protein [Aeromicrobium sp. YIM 150415]MBM9463260.1 helix-turn-helix domain-containing protein [Aeromicrobium sp. YIM 150415]
MSLLHEISDELTVRLNAPVGISDLSYDTLAAGPHPLDVDWVRRESLIGRVAPRTSQQYFAERGVVPEATGPVRTDADPAAGISARWIIPARWKDRTQGYIWVIDGDERLTYPEAARLMDEAGRVGEYLYRRASWLRDRADSVRQLVTGNRGALHDTAAHLYETAGYRPGPVMVAVVAVRGAEPDLLLPADLLDGPFPGGGTGEVWRYVDGRRAVLLIGPGSVGTDTVERTAEHVRDVTNRQLGGRGSAVVGIGGLAESLFAVDTAFRQARLAARAASYLPRIDDIASWDRLGALRMVLSIPDRYLPETLDPGVASLFDDSAFLAETLEIYFATGASVAETCRALSISRGTVYYRLQRAEALSGLSLKDGRDRLTLEVGLTVKRIIDGLAGDPLASAAPPVS